MRITSAPNWAIVMPPSGAATKAENSTMRRSSSSRFIAAPLILKNPALLSRSRAGAAIPCRRSRAEDDVVHDAAGQEGKDPGDDERAGKEADHRPPVPFRLMPPGKQNA